MTLLAEGLRKCDGCFGVINPKKDPTHSVVEAGGSKARVLHYHNGCLAVIVHEAHTDSGLATGRELAYVPREGR